MAELFGSLLRRFRARRGLNLSELAEALGANRMSIRAWEQGHRVPRDRARLEDLAQVLRLTSDEADQLADAARQHRFQAAANSAAVALWAEPATGTGSSDLAMQHQLRAPTADFVGRAIEVESLVTALQAALTPGGGAIISGVQGMGGIGKTELAYVAAHRVYDIFADAQLLLNLRGTSATPLRAEQALQTVIRAFLPDTRLPDELEALQARYLAVLHDKRVLILADDAHNAAQVRPLIPPRGSALLVTSRQRFILPGMALIDLEHLSEDEAVTLAQTICPFLKVAEARAITQACGYLPLAVRVSCGIVRNNPSLSISDYIQRLTDERQRLVHLRDPDDVQLNVAASLALSYVLLDEGTQQVFRQLGVVVADFDTALAQAVVETPEQVDVMGAMHELLRRNLVMYERERARWRLHDLVRDLARHYLEAAGELEATSWRCAQAVVQIAQATQDQYLAGADGVLEALVRFDAERPHIDAARRWAAAHAGIPAGDGLLLESALATLFISGLRYDRRRDFIPQMEQARLAAQRMGDRPSEGRTCNNLGLAYLELGEATQALLYIEQGLSIAREMGAQIGEMHLLNNLGVINMMMGEVTRAFPCFEQALIIARQVGDRRGEVSVLNSLGQAYADLGDSQRAIDAGKRALVMAQEIGDQREEGYAYLYLGRAHSVERHWVRASEMFEIALAILRAVGDRDGEAECLWRYGLALALQGERQGALSHLRATVAYQQEIGHTEAVERAALLARLEAGGELSEKVLLRTFS